MHDNKLDYLVSVPCACSQENSIHNYLYSTFYEVQPGDTLKNISDEIYSGQVWKVSEQVEPLVPGKMVGMHLVCGCLETESDQDVVTYTVQEDDTLAGIAALISAEVNEIEKLNTRLTRDPTYMDAGWVLFVPRENKGLQSSRGGKMKTWKIVIYIMVAVTTLVLVIMLILFLLRRNRLRGNNGDIQKAATKSPSTQSIILEKQFLDIDIEEVTQMESEKPVIISLEEIESATNNFDETTKIGEGGYGSVYFGIIREREAAIKKMRASKSKEFFAELKVLCKIHHINVVQLLGYASGNNHLYLVYEYIQNGPLHDHLQNPLLKGHQPLSWTARANIALDTARGIEYIHDHTKARYVHRDIKTSNILLDVGLRAKVADFGLTKLFKRSNEDDFTATRVVGTPGYLSPESLNELQATSKTDVFAYGVVLAELITGQRALVRDNQEPNRMKSLISVMQAIFRDKDPEATLAANIDETLKGSYPLEESYKMAKLAWQCLSENPINRPEMREVVAILAKIMTSSIEWEASLGWSSQGFSELLDGR